MTKMKVEDKKHMRLLTLKQVRDRVTLSKPEIYRRMGCGEFPKQIKLGAARVAWLESDIENWISNLVSNSAGRN